MKIVRSELRRNRFSIYESSKVVLGVVSMALALGWGKFIGTRVYLPFFPDILDVVAGVGIGIFLLFDYYKNSWFNQPDAKSVTS